MVLDSSRNSADDGAQPLIVTRDPDCLHDLSRLCAAAAVEPEVVGDPAAAGRAWARASCVLVGADCASDLVGLRLRRRPDVVLVGRAPEEPDLWRQAVAIRADEVAILPAAAGSIADRLADTAARGRAPAVVVGVVGAGCGAGASTVAASLAVVAARHGRGSLLVDADPLAAGLELLMGCEDRPGLRWPDLDVRDGRVAASDLLAALPRSLGVAVLSASRSAVSAIDPAVLTTVAAAGRRGCDLVVVDLPRNADHWFGEVASELDLVLVVASTELRSVAAARLVVGAAMSSCHDVRTVVRTCAHHRFDPMAIARTLAVPLAGVVPTSRAVRRAVNDGAPVVQGRRSRRAYDALLATVRGGGVS